MPHPDPDGNPEIAAVVDEREQQGLGRILLQALIDAGHESGIERFRAYVSASNQQVVESLAAIGATRSSTENGMVRLELPLSRSHLTATEAISITPTPTSINSGTQVCRSGSEPTGSQGRFG